MLECRGWKGMEKGWKKGVEEGGKEGEKALFEIGEGEMMGLI